MERKLLLLGLLRNHAMHGYQLAEFIDNTLASCVDLKKPTAYYLLNKMAEEGWVSFRDEQVGNHPPRRIYELTAEGEAQFQQMLRHSLARYDPLQFSSDIALAFVDSLPRPEVLALLQERQGQVEQLLAKVHSAPQHPGSFELLLMHQRQFLTAELAWLEQLIQFLAE